MNNNKKNKGQTLIELALMLPFFFLLVFVIYDFYLFAMELSIAKYAAFMAARSYQVYGDYPEKEDKKIYQEVADDIINRAMPYIKRDKIEILVDTATNNFTKTDGDKKFIDKEDWKKIISNFSLAEDNINLAYGNQKYEENPKFGILKLAIKRERLFNWEPLDAFNKIEVYTPYRLEERLGVHE
jgi:hypothetical protein